MAIETGKSYCRMCTAFCALEVDVEDGRVTAVRGDPGDPVSDGYTCLKGRQLPHQLHGPERLRASLRRRPDGSFESIPTQLALDEIAQRLARVLEWWGPRAVASYSGTAAFLNSASLPVTRAWHRGIGSPSNYSTLSIDQPAKIIAAARHGVWGGGGHSFASADVAISIGNNPIVSGLTLPGGPPGTNPVKALKEAKKRGLKLIVVDPRRSELARRADLHLQIRPGEDPTLLAGMLRKILEEGLHDAAFCSEYSEGLDELRAALEGFTPDYVERRSGVAAQRMIEAARLFAGGPRGYVSSGTGPDMAPHPCLTEHLICCLNTLCGRHNRQGERLENPGVLSLPVPRPAQAIPAELLPPLLRWGEGPASRFRGLRQMFEEMPTATLAEEILESGAGRVFDELEVEVAPPLPGVAARLQFAPEGVCEELRAQRAAAPGRDGFSHLLICRRLGHVSNSVGRDFPKSRGVGSTNPAYLHPADLENLGLSPGDVVEIESDHDRILGVVESSDELRSGVVSMAHCWGAEPERDAEVRTLGSNTGRLVATDRDYDSITGMARQSAIPVRLRRCAQAP